jgi:hypothetical protein
MNEVLVSRREQAAESLALAALKDAATKLGFVRLEDFDRWAVPADTVLPGATLAGG